MVMEQVVREVEVGVGRIRGSSAARALCGEGQELQDELWLYILYSLSVVILYIYTYIYIYICKKSLYIYDDTGYKFKMEKKLNVI